MVTLSYGVCFFQDNKYKFCWFAMLQDKLVEKDFNIEAEAHGVLKPVTRPFTANVSNHILEIRFQWAGKGTTAIPIGGVYGPLISAISVDPSE